MGKIENWQGPQADTVTKLNLAIALLDTYEGLLGLDEDDRGREAVLAVQANLKGTLLALDVPVGQTEVEARLAVEALCRRLGYRFFYRMAGKHCIRVPREG